MCAQPSGRHPVSVLCPAACKSTSVPTNPITSTEDNKRHQKKRPSQHWLTSRVWGKSNTLQGGLPQTSSLYSRATFSVRPQPTVLLKTTTPTTKLLTSFSRFLMAQNFKVRRTSKRCNHKSPSRQEFLINNCFLPIKVYQPMFDRKRSSLCYPTTPKHLPEPCAAPPPSPLPHSPRLTFPSPRHPPGPMFSTQRLGRTCHFTSMLDTP